MQIQAQRCRDIYPHSAKAFTLTNETDMYTLVIFPLSSLSCFSFFSSRLIGKWWVFGSYLDNSHIFPGSPCALREEAAALPLSQSGTQLCTTHSAQRYLVTAAASLRLPETKSSQSQLSLLLNSFLFSVMHLLGLFQDKRKKSPY